jgi:hypothetical protein
VTRLGEQLFSAPVVTAARVEQMIGVTRPATHEPPRIFEAVYGAVDVEDQ